MSRLLFLLPSLALRQGPKESSRRTQAGRGLGVEWYPFPPTPLMTAYGYKPPWVGLTCVETLHNQRWVVRLLVQAE